jgi:two-component system KDP operon response regulator KdpE
MSLLMNVLVVDDDAPLSRTLRSSLGAQGYLIFEARSGQEALQRAFQRPAELVLLDTEAPVMGKGKSAVASARESGGWHCRAYRLRQQERRC